MTPAPPLLTIAIPTYNRLEYLKELLPEMIKQCEPYPEIEILVSDNCTTDGSFSYIRDLATKNKMRYRANSSNVGADENFVRCVEAAKGKYIWLFGDDEILCKGAINKMISTLETYPASLFIIGNTRRIKPGPGSQFFRTYKEFIIYMKPSDVLDHTLITCNIFQKNMFDTSIARKYQSTNYGHMRAVITSLRKRGTVYFIDFPIFIIRNIRAPLQEPVPLYLVLKHIWYLLYLGMIYPKMLIYAIRYAAGMIYFKILPKSPHTPVVI